MRKATAGNCLCWNSKVLHCCKKGSFMLDINLYTHTHILYTQLIKINNVIWLIKEMEQKMKALYKHHWTLISSVTRTTQIFPSYHVQWQTCPKPRVGHSPPWHLKWVQDITVILRFWPHIYVLRAPIVEGQLLEGFVKFNFTCCIYVLPFFRLFCHWQVTTSLCYSFIQIINSYGTY